MKPTPGDRASPARYGLTGGIGCGKSEAARFLGESGWKMIDTDGIARRLMEPGEVNWKKVVDGFGAKILNINGTINRRALGELVFSQPALRGKLNDLTHPAIREAWIAERNDLLRFHSLVMVIIPLLFEVGVQREFDRIVCVGCSSGLQRERLRSRGWSDEHLRQRIDSQMPLEEKWARSDLAVWNEGSFAVLRRQLRYLLP